LRQIIPQIEVATFSDKTNRKGSIMWMDWFAAHPDHARKLGYTPGRHGSGTPWAANNVLASALIRKEGIRPKGRLPGSRYEKRPYYKKGLTLKPYQVTPQNGLHTPEVQKDIAELQEQAYQEVKAEVKSLREELKAQQATMERLRAELIEAKDVTFELLIQLQRAKVQIMELKKG